MSKIILDASALLALLKNESGSDQVEQVLGHVVMSTINVAEVATILMKSMTVLESRNCILPLLTQVIPYTADHAFQTAALQSQTKHRGLSLGDRACLALGIILQRPVYTADKIWADLNIDGLDVRLIR